MNTYEQKREERKERFLALAEKRQAESDTLYERTRKMSGVIPFGQPILVGHHSERGHRRLLEKIDNGMRKTIELEEKAKYYRSRAENISTSISSDDPDAIDKLKEKLISLENTQRRMKEENAEARSKKLDKPFASYQLSNNNSNIRNVRLRIKQLSAMREMENNEDIVGDWGRLRENKEENRIQFLFNSVPSPEIRIELKRNGFRWSPTNKAWQRMLDNRGRYLSKAIISQL